MNIDAIRIHFDPSQLLLINICLGFLMFSVALDLSISDFKRVFEHPKSVIVGLTSQLILLPIFTIILVLLWQPPASVALGLALIAACPGGNISNYTVHLARGNTALSVTLTSIVTAFAILTTPLLFSVLVSLLPSARALMEQISLNYYDLVKTIFILMLVPLCLGMTFRAYFPIIVDKIKGWISKIALLIFIIFIIGAVFSNLDILRNHIHHVLLIVIVHNLSAIIIGYSFARMNKLDKADVKTIAIETGIQNSGLGLVVIFNFFSQLGGMMLVAAWWGIWDMISAVIIALKWRKS